MFLPFLLLAHLLNAQEPSGRSSEQGLQKLAEKMIARIQNLDENLGLLEDIQDILRLHSDFFFNALPKMQTDPEFEPYLEEYKALKGQYMGNGEPMPINPNIKIVLTRSPFVMAPSYDKNLKQPGVCLHPSNLIIIDRGFWEYYKDNDEVRKAVVIHELGHCDLNQEHSHNDIMNTVWEDDLLNSRVINWIPLYEEFFVMQQRYEVIMCSEENFHLYYGCSPYMMSECSEQENNFICYTLREYFVNDIRDKLSFIKCLLFDLRTSTCTF